MLLLKWVKMEIFCIGFRKNLESSNRELVNL